MKLELLQEELHKGLATVSRFISSRPQLPILANILFSAQKDNRLCLSATNMEIGIQYWLGAKVDQEGQLAVPAREINEFVSYLSPGKISLEEKKKTQIKVASSQGEGSFAGMDPGEFPQIPTIKKNQASSLPMKGLVEAVNQVSFASAADETRPTLGAINWLFNKKGYRMVATDGYRLSLKDVSQEVKVKNKEERVSFLIPARSLNEVVRLAADEEAVGVGLTDEGNQVVFLLPNVEISSRLIEGRFPDYEKIIPAESKTKVSLDKEELFQAIRAASVFARESANIVKFSLKNGKVVISANAPSVGENRSEVEARIDGPDLDIAFNYRFLLDFLNAVPAKKKGIEMGFNESLSPGVFRISSDPSWLHLIMPVRVDL